MQTKWGCLRLCLSLWPNPALAVRVALRLTLAPEGRCHSCEESRL